MLEIAVVALFPVATNLQDGLRVFIYGDAVGKRQTSDLALLLVLKARDVQLAVALVDRVGVILGTLRVGAQPRNIPLGTLN